MSCKPLEGPRQKRLDGVSTIAQKIAYTSDFNWRTRLFTDFEDWHTEPSEFFEADDRVFAIGTYSARAKATRRAFKARFAHLWTLREGVIVRLQQCADTVQLARALEP